MTRNPSTQFDNRLDIPFTFLCKIIGVQKEKFLTLALANLLDEEFDEIENTNHFEVNFEKLIKYKNIVKVVKIDANSWVVNQNEKSKII